jgi:hypothetical protein
MALDTPSFLEFCYHFALSSKQPNLDSITFVPNLGSYTSLTLLQRRNPKSYRLLISFTNFL